MSVASTFSDKISDLKKDEVKNTSEEEYLCNLFLVNEQTHQKLSIWKMCILFIAIIVCLLPLPFFKSLNENYVLIGKIIFIMIIIILLFYI